MELGQPSELEGGICELEMSEQHLIPNSKTWSAPAQTYLDENENVLLFWPNQSPNWCISKHFEFDNYLWFWHLFLEIESTLHFLQENVHPVFRIHGQCLMLADSIGLLCC